MKNILPQLHEIAEIKFSISISKLSPLISSEANLRKAIAELRQRSTDKVLSNDNFLFERSGARYAWENWSSTQIQKLNCQLASVLAQKEELMVAAKKDFARTEAIRLMLADRGR